MVTAKTHMYKKIKFHTHENVGWGEISLPEMDLHTTAYWFTVPSAGEGGMDRDAIQSALIGAAHVLGNIASLELMCEPGDLGVAAQVKSPFTSAPTVFIYDKYPGGVGFSEQLFSAHRRLMERAYSLVSRCPCPAGCPSCVGPADEVGIKGKEYVLRLLKEVMGDGPQEQAAPSSAQGKA
jgi:DEAD/DEAH box helicase domain-containing protein